MSVLTVESMFMVVYYNRAIPPKLHQVKNFDVNFFAFFTLNTYVMDGNKVFRLLKLEKRSRNANFSPGHTLWLRTG